jgi:hypothetical protein
MKPTTILLLAAAAIGIYMYTKKADNNNQDAGGGTPTDKKDAPTDTYDADKNPLGPGGQVVANNTASNAAAGNYVQDRVNGHY